MIGGLLTLGAKLPDFDPQYIFHLEYLYEEDNTPVPHSKDFRTTREALDGMINVWNSGKTLVHISLSRRNA